MAKSIYEINREFEREYLLTRLSLPDKSGLSYPKTKSPGKNILKEKRLSDKERINKVIAQVKEKHNAVKNSASYGNPVMETGAVTIKSKRFIGRITSFLFYAILSALIIMAFSSGVRTGLTKNIFGYSYFAVLTNSMQSKIPQGSLVFTKETDPNHIRRGDDITYIKEDGTTVTHRVETIIDDYEGSGSRGFQTKGIENAKPDDGIVRSPQVVGVVRMCIPKAGFVMNYLGENPLMKLSFLAIAFLWLAILRWKRIDIDSLSKLFLKKYVRRRGLI